MVTSAIGRLFLEAYNERHKTNYTPKYFFKNIYCPLFYGNEKVFLWVGNSPFAQKFRKDKPLSPHELEQIKIECIEAIDHETNYHMGLFVGYKPKSLSQETSGQTCIHDLKIDPEEVYLSWIGAGMGISVEKGGRKRIRTGTDQQNTSLTILFYCKELLLDIFDGWEEYRDLLTKQNELKARQVTKWNAQWIRKKYSPLLTSPNNVDFLKRKGKNVLEIEGLLWTDLLACLCKHFSMPKMLGYVYNIGKTNTTIGFIPFILSPIRKTHELFVKLFGEHPPTLSPSFWTTEYGFDQVCQKGAIGLAELEPLGTKQLLWGHKKENETIGKNLYSYQTWLLAMLNNEQLWKESEKFASTLRLYQKGQKEDRTNRDNAIDELLSHPSKHSFIRHIAPIIKDIEKEGKEDIMKICEIINSMPTDNVPYFIGLAKIHYLYNNK